MENEDVELSLVVPAFNEQEVIPELIRRIEPPLRQTGKRFEVIVIDDGSTDQTPRLLADAAAQHSWLRTLRMAKNCGQSAAFDAGFKAAQEPSSPPSTPICKTTPRKSPACSRCSKVTT